jgi:hypothetical protein
MRHDVVDHVRERAVAIVAVQKVGRLEIVRDVQVRPAVVVVIPPRRGVSLGFDAADSGGNRYI